MNNGTEDGDDAVSHEYVVNIVKVVMSDGTNNGRESGSDAVYSRSRGEYREGEAVERYKLVRSGGFVAAAVEKWLGWGQRGQGERIGVV